MWWAKESYQHEVCNPLWTLLISLYSFTFKWHPRLWTTWQTNEEEIRKTDLWGWLCGPYSYNAEEKGNTRKGNKIPEAQRGVSAHENWQDRYRLSKQRFCWHNDENRITRFVVSSKATMVRAIFAECIVSPQRDHNYPKVKCLAAPVKVKAAIFLHMPCRVCVNHSHNRFTGQFWWQTTALCFTEVTCGSLLLGWMFWWTPLMAFSLDTWTKTPTNRFLQDTKKLFNQRSTKLLWH